MGMDDSTRKVSLTERLLGGIERACNKLPSPVMLFLDLFVIIAVISWIASVCGFELINPATGKMVTVRNFFSQEGLNWILTNFVKNFVGFASLGLVLTMTVGINLCEQVGLVDALLRKSTGGVNGAILPYVIALIGTCGNLASDTCSVLVPPLGALAFMGAGRSPIVGMFCGWLSANLGFSANLFIAGTDSLLAGITNTSIKILLGPDATFEVDSACNWYFMFCSTILITLIVGWCTNHLIEKRVGPYKGETMLDTTKPLTDLERKGLRKAGIALLVYAVVIVAGAQQFILEKMPTWIDKYGKNTAFFCTNDAQTEPMLKSIVEHGGYFIEADLPSPLMGYPGALGLDLADVSGNFEAILKRVEDTVVARGAGGRMGVWAYSLGFTTSKALGEFAVDCINQGVTHQKFRRYFEIPKVVKFFDAESPNSSWKGRYYADAQTDVESKNHILILQDTYMLGAGPQHMTDIEVPEKYLKIH